MLCERTGQLAAASGDDRAQLTEAVFEHVERDLVVFGCATTATTPSALAALATTLATSFCHTCYSLLRPSGTTRLETELSPDMGRRHIEPLRGDDTDTPATGSSAFREDGFFQCRDTSGQRLGCAAPFLACTPSHRSALPLDLSLGALDGADCLAQLPGQALGRLAGALATSTFCHVACFPILLLGLVVPLG